MSNRYTQIEYLDLDINTEKYSKKKKIIALEFHQIQCNFGTLEEKYCHPLHNEDRQFNTIVDLLINLSENNKIGQEKICRIIEEFLNHYRKTISSWNFDFIKDQLSQIELEINNLQRFSHLESLPSKQEIKTLIR